MRDWGSCLRCNRGTTSFERVGCYCTHLVGLCRGCHLEYFAASQHCSLKVHLSGVLALGFRGSSLGLHFSPMRLCLVVNVSVGVKTGRFCVQRINSCYYQNQFKYNIKKDCYLDSLASQEIYLKAISFLGRGRASNKKLRSCLFGVLACQFLPVFTPTERLSQPSQENGQYTRTVVEQPDPWCLGTRQLPCRGRAPARELTNSIVGALALITGVYEPRTFRSPKMILGTNTSLLFEHPMTIHNSTLSIANQGRPPKALLNPL